MKKHVDGTGKDWFNAETVKVDQYDNRWGGLSVPSTEQYKPGSMDEGLKDVLFGDQYKTVYFIADTGHFNIFWPKN